MNLNFVSSGSAVIAIPMSNEQTPHLFYELKRGVSLPDDWFTGKIPDNIEVGENTVLDSSVCFKHYFSVLPVGLLCHFLYVF